MKQITKAKLQEFPFIYLKKLANLEKTYKKYAKRAKLASEEHRTRMWEHMSELMAVEQEAVFDDLTEEGYGRYELLELVERWSNGDY